MSEAKKKIVRFGRGEGKSMEEECGWSEPQIKDSGIDTGMSSSSQTLNDDWLKVLGAAPSLLTIPATLLYYLCVGQHSSPLF